MGVRTIWAAGGGAGVGERGGDGDEYSVEGIRGDAQRDGRDAWLR
jgi:hypothetical protein